MNDKLIDTLDADQRRSLDNVRAAVARLWARPLHRHYTDHTVTHSERIITLLNGLTAGVMATTRRLTHTEVFCLLAAAYVHDIGMQNERFAGGNIEDIRAQHHEQTAEMIYAVFEDPAHAFAIPLTREPGLVEAVALVAKGHRRVDLAASEYELFVHGSETVRPRLLAALLRFADELDIDHRRVDLEQMKLLALPVESQLHWWRCHYVGGVSIADEYIRISYRFPLDRPDYESLIVPLVEGEIRSKHAALETIFRANAVKVALGPSQVRLMRLVQPLPPEVEALARQWFEAGIPAIGTPATNLLVELTDALQIAPVGAGPFKMPGIPQLTQVEDVGENTYLSSTRNLPPLSKHFVDRCAEIELLKARFGEPRSFITLVGLGGIGKSSLAVAVIQELEGEGRFADGVFWLDGRQHTNLGALVMILGGLLRLDLSQRTLAEQRQAVNYILRDKDALVALDNFESVSVTESTAVVEFLRSLPCDVLVTSRVRLPESEEPFQVPPLDHAAALELFAAISGNDLAPQDSDANALCIQDLEGHPLAIEMMAALTATGLRATELRQYLRESPRVVLDDTSDGLIEIKSVVQALNTSYRRLTPMAQTVLIRASVYSADFDLTGLTALMPDQSRLTLAKALQELKARSLLQSAGPALYRLHAVTRQYAYGLLDERAVYHHRAAEYFLTKQGNDSLAAVEQFLMAGAEHKAAILTPEHIQEWIHNGRASKALAVLSSFDPHRLHPRVQAMVYEARSDLQYLLGELDEAVRQYEEAIETVTSADVTIRVRLHRKLGDVLARKGEYDDALACLIRGRDLLTGISNTMTEGARLAVGYGTVLLTLGRYDEAVAEAQAALNQLPETSAHPRIAADLHDLIGKVHFFKGNFAKSLERFQSALELRKVSSNQQGMIKSYSNLAVVYSQQNRYAKALQANKAALEIAERIGDKVALATLYMNMAADYIDQKAYDQAIDYNERTLALSEEMGNVYQLAITHHNLGDLYRRIEHFDLAAEHLTQAVEFADQVGDQDGVIGGMKVMAEVYMAQGRVKDALTQCMESLRQAESIGNQFWRPWNFDLLGRIHHLIGQWNEARTDFNEASQIWRERKAWLELSSTLLSWARLERDAGQANRARKLCAEAATLADKYEANDLMKQASILLLELASAVNLEEGMG